MKIAAKMIVFQADSVLPNRMLQHCIKHIYPHVDQLLICEGATNGNDPNHWDGDTGFYTKDGRSSDGTLGIIASTLDPQRKITFVRTNGFANGKTAMFNQLGAYVRDDIDYIWQVDSDEFYADPGSIVQLLERSRPDVVQFFAHHFWGDFLHCVSRDSYDRWGNDIPWTRIFRHEPWSKWKSHEPPEYVGPCGTSRFQGKVLTREDTRDLGIYLYHYSCVCKTQAEFKSRFFKNPDYIRLFTEWQRDRSIPIINGARTERFEGEHPKIIKDNYL